MERRSNGYLRVSKGAMLVALMMDMGSDSWLLPDSTAPQAIRLSSGESNGGCLPLGAGYWVSHDSGARACPR